MNINACSGFAMSLPPGITVIRQKDKPSMAFKYLERYSPVPSAFHESPLAASCPVFGRTLTRGRCAGGAAAGAPQG